MVLILFLALLILFFMHLGLSARVKQCELYLAKISDSRNPAENQPKPQEAAPPPPPVPVIAPKEEVSQPSILPPKDSVRSHPQPPRWLQLIKENWLGIVGSMAIVIGAVFFGLTSEIMQRPEARVSIMIGLSIAAIVACQTIKRIKTQPDLCSWLIAISAAVILFATFGAGSIEALKFIHSPFHALLFLCFGIAVNLYLAFKTHSQVVASLHVILCILAFCVAPQAMILLPLGALVAIIGLLSGYRSKWDCHLMAISIAFAFQNAFWTFALGDQLLPWMHHLAIFCSVAVGLIGASIHYDKKLQAPLFEAMPLAAHLINWALLAWNVWLHAQFFTWTPLILGSISAGGFALAYTAKKRGIDWLYYTDTLLAQITALTAIASLAIFQISALDLCLLILLETILFNEICRFQGETLLLRSGLFVQFAVCAFSISFALEKMHQWVAQDHMGLLFRLCAFTAIIWGQQIFRTMKGHVIDDYRFIFFGENKPTFPVSLSSMVGVFFFLSFYIAGISFSFVPLITLSVIASIGLWRKWSEDQTWNIIFILTLAFVHLIGLTLLTQMYFFEVAVLNTGLIGIIALDAFLIGANQLEFAMWKINLHRYLIYAFWLLVGLYLTIATQQINWLLPAVLFLGCSLTSLEIGRLLPRLSIFSQGAQQEIQKGSNMAGLSFLAVFFLRFSFTRLFVADSNGLFVRLMVEALAILTMVYWIVTLPKVTEEKGSRRLINGLLHLCIWFVTLCTWAEIPAHWRPLIWSCMAIAVLIATCKYNLPKKLFGYSWLYFIASVMNTPLNSLIDILPSLLAIALQICYAFLVQRKQGEIISSLDSRPTSLVGDGLLLIFRQINLVIVLPIFLGVAYLLALNFERTLLTLLWVGLIGLYMCLGLFLKSKRSIQFGMAALACCSLRLILFDLNQSDLAIRALVFIGVGTLMLCISLLYKKYKHRIEMTL